MRHDCWRGEVALDARKVYHHLNWKMVSGTFSFYSLIRANVRIVLPQSPGSLFASGCFSAIIRCMDRGQRPVSIIVRYDKKLQEITGSGEVPVLISEGAKFPYLLVNIFYRYPEIERQYPPGYIALTVNDVPPTSQTVLCEGDIVALSVAIGG